MADVTLSSAVRTNLFSLQETALLTQRTQTRLSSGLAVQSAIDDAIKFFAAKSLRDRAGDLAARKDSINQGVNAVKTAVESIAALEKLTSQIKAVLDAARSGTDDQRKEFSTQIGQLAWQIQKLVGDSSYQGINLINSTSSKLTVRFSEKSDSKIEVDGVNFNVSEYFLDTDGAALGIAITSETMAADVLTKLGFSQLLSGYLLSEASVLAVFNTQVDQAIAYLDKTISNARAKAATLSSSVTILQVRLDFTQNYIGVLKDGADKLTLADLNEEGANLLALQTRQQLGIQALAFAGQSETAILGLFR